MKCKHCGKEIEAYFRGREKIWKHKAGRVRHCGGFVMNPKAELESSDCL
jgi:hypothetical protein